MVYRHKHPETSGRQGSGLEGTAATAMTARPPALAVLAASLALVVYANTLHNPFVYDDRTEVLENPSIRGLADLPHVFTYNLTRPITNLSYAVDYAFSGLDPIAYHVTSLLLHLTAVALLFTLVRELVRDADGIDHDDGAVGADAGAFVAGALLAVHPMMTEAVGYISSRADLLCGVFVLASLLCFRRAFSGRSLWAAAGWLLFLLAVASKETGVMLPFLLLAYDRLLVTSSNEQRRARMVRIHAPLLAAVTVVALVRAGVYVAIEQRGGSFELAWRNVPLQFYAIGRYLGMLAAPYNQSVVPAMPRISSGWETPVLTSVVLLAVMIWAAYRRRRTLPLVALGVVWFLLMLAPSAALLVLADVGQAMAEHRAYLAYCGIFLAVGSVVAKTFPPRLPIRPSKLVGVGSGVALALALFMALSIARNHVWSDPVGLWEEAVRRDPDGWFQNYGAADAYRTRGDLASAAASYEKAIALYPDNPQVYSDLADVLITLERFGRTRDVLEAALRLEPGNDAIRLRLATLEGDVFHNRQRGLDLCRAALLGAQRAMAEECVRRYEPEPPSSTPPAR